MPICFLLWCAYHMFGTVFPLVYLNRCIPTAAATAAAAPCAPIASRHLAAMPRLGPARALVEALNATVGQVAVADRMTNASVGGAQCGGGASSPEVPLIECVLTGGYGERRRAGVWCGLVW